ncbi:MAG: hypothetical protein LYZ70_00065 [Nitrososphaerales archaeon]|nr:hypothetical protein [Nitrososphaerales archaeon]
MEPRRRAVGTTAAAAVVISAIIVAAVTIALVTSPPGMFYHPLQSTGNIGSSTPCSQPAYLMRLALRVEETQSFAQQSHGLSYVLASGNNDSATTGTNNGKPYYSPPKTNLALYSYGTASTAVCPSNLGTKGVIGALWIHVPLNSDGSYNLANMSIYFTPGVFTNSTVASTSTVSYTTITTCVTTTQGSQRVVNCGSPSVTYTGTNTNCVITGQPGGAFLRILSDSTLAPVTGAVVTATHDPAGCILNGVEYTNTATTQTFTTNGTEWMSLDTTNGGSYSFTVEYSGHSYTFTAELSPVSLICATLYVPSGRTNSTITEFKSTCP